MGVCPVVLSGFEPEQLKMKEAEANTRNKAALGIEFTCDARGNVDFDANRDNYPDRKRLPAPGY